MYTRHTFTPRDVVAWFAALAFLLVTLAATGTASAQDHAAVAEAAPVQVTSHPAAVAEKSGEAAAFDNPYGLEALWAQGDFVAKGTLVILVIMSAGTWYVLVLKLIEQHKLLSEARDVDRRFWHSPTLKAGMANLKTGGAFWYISDRGLSADAHHEGTLVEQIDRSTWITMSVNRAVDAISSKLSGGLAVLATVGSTAPFVGLFGTVWGIYHALTAIGMSGQASIDKVAGPVGEALIMTAIGLAVAVPAVLGYNWLVRRNKQSMDSVRSFASDVHSVLLSGARVGDKVRKIA